MDVKIEFNSCGINADTLDDWLESDLRQSGILPSDNNNNDKEKKNIKCGSYDFSAINHMKWERQSSVDGSDDNTTVVNDSDFITNGGDITKGTDINKDNLLLSSTDITPFLKALAILTNLHQQGQSSLININNNNNNNDNITSTISSTISPLSTLLPSVINPLEMTKKNPTSKTPRTIIPNLITKTSNNNDTFNTTTPPTMINIKKRNRDEEKEEEKSLHPNPNPNNSNNNEGIVDPILLKRQKNTDAARRSRLRKVLKMEAMEKRVAELEKSNEQLRVQVVIVETERDNAKLKEAQQRERVAKLEEQLAEAHRSLLLKDQHQLQQQNKEDDDNNKKVNDDGDDDDLKKVKKEVSEN